MIEVYVKNQYIEFIEKEVATTYSINYFKIHFLFDESWEKYVKHVTFFSTQKGERYVMQIKESNTVYVSNEVLKDNLPVYFGLYGENADGIRITTNTLQIPLVNSAYAPNSTIVDQDFVELRDFVKTEPDKIQYIREKEGVFEYSLDGIRWTQVRGKQGLGLPSGGEVGQYLVKSSINNYETTWKDFDKGIDKNSENGASSKAVAEYVDNSFTEYDKEIKEHIQTEIKNSENSNVIEKVFVSNSSGETELPKTDKAVTIDLKPYLSKFNFGSIEKTVLNNVLSLTQNDIETEIKKIISTATSTANGFMSKEDKVHLDTLYNLLGETTNDADSFVDTIREILDIFNQYPEGTNLINALGQKVDKETFNTAIQGINNTLNTKVDKTIFNSNIQTLANQVSQKVDKVVGKGLSTNDYTNEEKQKLSLLPYNTENKGLSKYDFDDSYKNKVNNSVSQTALNDILGNYLQKTRQINGQELSKDLNISVYKGSWQIGTQYYVGDMVSYGELVWVCIIAHQPDDDDKFNASFWKILSYQNEPNVGTKLGLFTYEEKQKLGLLPYNIDNKSLSTNDFTNEYKTKLENIQENATFDTSIPMSKISALFN
jgi:hypothetical protein